jgi:acid phosphatase type 7
MKTALVAGLLAGLAGCADAHGKFMGPIPTKSEVIKALTELTPDLKTRVRATQLFTGSPAPLQPQQLRIALTNDATQMQVVWVTMSSCSGSLVYWPENNALANKTAAAVETSYTTQYPAGFGWNGTIHTAFATGLTPSSRYSYSVGCGVYAPGTVMWSTPNTFTQPAIPSADQSVKVAVLADMGTVQPLGFTVAAQLIKEHDASPFDLISLSGDVAYATLDPPNNEVESSWDLFGVQSEPFASNAPFMLTVGNHENVPGTFIDSNGQSHPNTPFVAYTTRYNMQPSNAIPGSSGMYYSYEHGPVHYTSICSECDYSTGSAQWNWIKQDLASVDRTKTPWVIATLHRPVYSADTSEYDAHSPGCPLSVALEPLFLEAAVDLVLTGHEHCYERSASVFNGTVVAVPDASGTYTSPKAPIYVLQGTSGAWQKETRVSPIPAWSLVFTNGVYGYGRMQISTNATAATRTLFYQFVDTSGNVHDTWSIVKAI